MTPQLIQLLEKEIKKAETKWPGWPENLYIGHAIISEELGELAQAILDYNYSNGEYKNIIQEALHTAVTSIRMVQSLIE